MQPQTDTAPLDDEAAKKARRKARAQQYYQKNKERHRERAREWQAKNRDKLRAAHRAWCTENPDKMKRARDMWRKANLEHDKKREAENKRQKYAEDPETYRAKAREWRKANRAEVKERDAKRRAANPEKYRARSRAWRKKNPQAAAAHASARAALMRLPVEKGEARKIKEFYEAASSLGLVVDHVIPLRGKNVSGLHRLRNLQLLTREENCRKHNSFPLEGIQEYFDC